MEADEEVNRFLKCSNALDARDDDDASRSSLAITADRAGGLSRSPLTYIHIHTYIHTLFGLAG